MPMINIEDAYILDNTGKQVDDAVDYALANSNRNLLDNPFFTVNQRNITSLTVGTEKTYTLDRWYAFRAKITALSGGGITFAWNGTDLTSGLLAQASAYDLRGKTVTMSAIINGKVFSWTAPFTGTSVSYTFSGLNIRFQLAQAGSNTYAQIFIMTATPVTISAIKLELGFYSTLANDVPPDYGEELRKCRFYYRRYANPLAGGTAISATAADFTDNEPMYGGNAGTLAYKGTVQVNGVAVTGKTLYSRSDGKISQNTMRFNVSGGLTAYGSALINLGANSYIELSHDL